MAVEDTINSVLIVDRTTNSLLSNFVVDSLVLVIPSFQEDDIFTLLTPTDIIYSHRTQGYLLENQNTGLTGPLFALSEIEGADVYIVANTASYFYILDGSLVEVHHYDLSPTSVSISSVCTLKDTAWLGVGGDEESFRGGLFRMPHLCYEHCYDQCNYLPKDSPSMSHGCMTCPLPRILKGEGTCEFPCLFAGEYQNATNDGCQACPSCCAGDCEYDYITNPSNPVLVCLGTVDSEFTWDDGACTPITIANPTVPQDPAGEAIGADYEVIFNRKRLEFYIKFELEPISLSMDENIKLEYNSNAKHELKFEKARILPKNQIDAILSQQTPVNFMISLNIDMEDYTLDIHLSFKNLFYLDSETNNMPFK